jgi:ribose transport system substrate-binding protein
MLGHRLILGRFTALMALLLVVAVLGACGDDDDSGDSGSSNSGGATSDAVAEAQQTLDKFSTAGGSYHAPPTDSPKPEPGKSIVVIPFAQGIPAFAAEAKAIQAVGKELGWNVRVVDGKFEPNAWLAGIRDAITAKADGIILMGPDCPPIKAALQEAKAADIAVINAEGHDCDTFDPDAEPLFTYQVPYSEGTLIDWLKQLARLQAAWAIAETNGEAKVLFLFETDAHTFKVMGDEFKKELSKCGGCEIVETVTLTGADYGPKLQQKTEQALLRHPEANIVWPGGTETLLPAGVAAAVRASQSKPPSTGWECDEGALENFETGVLGVCFNWTPQWEAYAAVDALIRIFAGEEPSDDTGLGIRLVDKEHNLDKLTPYEAPIDFAGAYEKAWGID